MIAAAPTPSLCPVCGAALRRVRRGLLPRFWRRLRGRAPQMQCRSCEVRVDHRGQVLPPDTTRFCRCGCDLTRVFKRAWYFQIPLAFGLHPYRCRRCGRRMLRW